MVKDITAWPPLYLWIEALIEEIWMGSDSAYFPVIYDQKKIKDKGIFGVSGHPNLIGVAKELISHIK